MLYCSGLPCLNKTSIYLNMMCLFYTFVSYHIKCTMIQGLWYLTPLSTMFQLYRGGQFYWWRNIMFYLVHLIKLTTLGVMDTDCTSSCESNYLTIMTTRAPGTITTIQSVSDLTIRSNISLNIPCQLN
jgi:hypothetical protein